MQEIFSPLLKKSEKNHKADLTKQNKKSEHTKMKQELKEEFKIGMLVAHRKLQIAKS
jgi:hypothetical protein